MPLTIQTTHNNGCTHTHQKKKSQTQMSISWFCANACGTSKAACPSKLVPNTAPGSVKLLWKLTGQPIPKSNLTTGVVLLTNPISISVGHPQTCGLACPWPYTTTHINGCKHTHQEKKSQTQISISWCLLMHVVPQRLFAPTSWWHQCPPGSVKLLWKLTGKSIP